jgi:F-type H+-transporting ATPase subunit g
VDGLKQLLKSKKELKVEEAGIAVMFGVELCLWFTAGEIIGRGFTITGYKV